MSTIRIKSDSNPKKDGAIPGCRMGHTMSMIGQNVFVFGGIVENLGPSNELWVLRMRDKNNFDWRQQTEKKGDDCDWPPPRWRHTSNIMSPTEVIIFGGYHKDTTERYNDIWVYNVVTLGFKRPMTVWSKWREGGNHVKHIRCPQNVPCPRGAHASAVLQEKLFVFGGYGGWKYDIDYLNDVYILDLKTWEWSSPKIEGRGPSPRRGHKACTINGSELIVLGGCHDEEQFSDVFLFEVKNQEHRWVSLNCELPIPRSYFAAINVSKEEDTIIVFGGMCHISLMKNPLGSRLNDALVIESSHSNISVQMTMVCGNIEARSDMDMVYYEKEKCIILFGGWGEIMYNDIHYIPL